MRRFVFGFGGSAPMRRFRFGFGGPLPVSEKQPADQDQEEEKRCPRTF
jgi:hypothetical protein